VLCLICTKNTWINCKIWYIFARNCTLLLHKPLQKCHDISCTIPGGTTVVSSTAWKTSKYARE